MPVEPTYFTCTLGQVESLGIRQPHQTINKLLDAKSREQPSLPAVGFALPSSNTSWQAQVFTFRDIHQGSCYLAHVLAQKHEKLAAKRSTVALLCPSTPDFLFTWLALIRLGHAVLLIAPQCAPSAVAALCEQCEVELLFYDESYEDLAKQSTDPNQRSQVEAIRLPFDRTLKISDIIMATEIDVNSHPVAGDDVAYLHHTSGTSTGIPKPIPQTHHAGVGVLPQLEAGKHCATFTTTPLYHGGVADFFRATTSSAMIWLFPGKSVPITASNIIKCLEVAHAQESCPPVKYFSSVPYVLQMLESDKRGLSFLQGMDMVGVGGAALPVEIGNRLVSKSVNLLSRFGSAECGFLLSSHRDYKTDKAWQYLRCAQDQQFLRFERQESGLSELIILKGWPHMAKRNRNDGSFATADLFEPHESISGAWKYHSRADSQLTLNTGKKFDPAPIEADIATSELLSDAIVFGNGQPYPGVLLFRSTEAEKLSDAALSEALWPLVFKLNQDSQDHAKISKSMLMPMPVLPTPLEKSSKGTLLRGAAEQRFERDIERAYDSTTTDEDIADEHLSSAIGEIVNNVSHKKLSLDQDTDLFSAGIDSVAGMQIRSRLRALLPKDKRNLPMTFVEDCGSIGGLASYVRRQRRGDNEHLDEDAHAYMLQLVEEYSKFKEPVEAMSDAVNEETIILTGATGALGAHILSQYQSSTAVKKIYCLVRGSDDHAARERVEKALQQRCLPSLSSKVVILHTRLGDADLGLQPQMYRQLTQEATTIMHVAWSVNFRMRLRSFVKDNIAGVQNLLNLALASTQATKPLFGFCSSVASVMSSPEDEVAEAISHDPATASPLGYSQSKWVAEQICDRANTKTPLAGRIAVFRVGQLSGDTVHGVWNSSEAWPLMLSSSQITHSLPDLRGEVLDWLPVDLAATALVEGAAYVWARTSKDVAVFHVMNYHNEPSWSDMIQWLQGHTQIEVISPTDWVQRLSKLNDEGSTHPALKLLSHWQTAYKDSDTASSNHRKGFATLESKSKLAVLRQIEPVDEVYFQKLWQWVVREM